MPTPEAQSLRDSAVRVLFARSELRKVEAELLLATGWTKLGKQKGVIWWQLGNRGNASQDDAVQHSMKSFKEKENAEEESKEEEVVQEKVAEEGQSSDD